MKSLISTTILTAIILSAVANAKITTEGNFCRKNSAELTGQIMNSSLPLIAKKRRYFGNERGFIIATSEGKPDYTFATSTEVVDGSTGGGLPVNFGLRVTVGLFALPDYTPVYSNSTLGRCNKDDEACIRSMVELFVEAAQEKLCAQQQEN